MPFNIQTLKHTMLLSISYKLKIFIILLIAPFLGLGIAYLQTQPFLLQEAESLLLGVETYHDEASTLSNRLIELEGTTVAIRTSTGEITHLMNKIHKKAEGERRAYEQQHTYLQELVDTSAEQSLASTNMLDYVLSNMLGDPIGQTFGKNATIKVYSLKEAGYRGYMAKVRLHNSEALKMVLAGDRVKSRGETTSAAARRTGAVLAVNAGGFFAHEGALVPLGTTVVDGKILSFSSPDSNLSFIGFNRNGQLVGGKVDTKEELLALDVLHGCSFLPTLLKGGEKQTIPADWANTRQPRTLIGHFVNNDLLFVVIDGRQKGWSNGVTLEEAQEKLLEFKVRDAYNLDGGGSSTFYYDGKVLNHPSDGKERRVVSNIVILP